MGSLEALVLIADPSQLVRASFRHGERRSRRLSVPRGHPRDAVRYPRNGRRWDDGATQTCAAVAAVDQGNRVPPADLGDNENKPRFLRHRY